jgi:hypothetical protein
MAAPNPFFLGLLIFLSLTSVVFDSVSTGSRLWLTRRKNSDATTDGWTREIGLWTSCQYKIWADSFKMTDANRATTFSQCGDTNPNTVAAILNKDNVSLLGWDTATAIDRIAVVRGLSIMSIFFGLVWFLSVMHSSNAILPPAFQCGKPCTDASKVCGTGAAFFTFVFELVSFAVFLAMFHERDIYVQETAKDAPSWMAIKDFDYMLNASFGLRVASAGLSLIGLVFHVAIKQGGQPTNLPAKSG